MSKTARDLFDDEIEVLGKDEWHEYAILIDDCNRRIANYVDGSENYEK